MGRRSPEGTRQVRARAIRRATDGPEPNPCAILAKALQFPTRERWSKTVPYDPVTLPATETDVVTALADSCVALGVDTAFGLLGSGNFELTRKLVARGVRAVAARHESGVVTMADTWAQATGRVGFCTLHQGPGFTNAITSLVEAARSRTPLVVFVAETACHDWAANQRLDPTGLAREAGASIERVRSARDAVPALMRAWRTASHGRTPVVLSVPIDIQAERNPFPVDADAVMYLVDWRRSRDVLDLESVRRAAELVAAARRPVILAGRGAVLDDARSELTALADHVGALLATTAQGLGMFSDHPWSLGVCGGFASPQVQRLVADSDLVLAFGAALNRWTTGHGDAITDSTVVVQVDIDPTAFGKHRAIHSGVLGSVSAVASSLRDLVPTGTGYRGALGSLDDIAWPLADRPVTAGTIDPAVLVHELDSRLPQARNMTFDGGHHTWFPLRHMTPSHEGRTVFPQAFQAVGLGLASSVGLAVARPELTTLLFAGDGGALMALGELDAVQMCGERILIVVMDDGAYGAEVHHFGQHGQGTDIVRFGTRDFAGVARSLGVNAATVTSVQELDGALQVWERSGGRPFLIDCKIDPNIRSEQADLPFQAER